MYFELAVVTSYFLFLFGLMLTVRNVEHIANHPTTQRVIGNFTYNLRDLPRVNYKDPSSDEDEDDQDDQDDQDQDEEEEEEAWDPNEVAASERCSVDATVARLEEEEEDAVEALLELKNGCRQRRKRDPNPISRIIEESNYSLSDTY